MVRRGRSLGLQREIGQMAARAVFLDRDGILNLVELRGGKPYPPQQLTEDTITPGIGPALVRLKQRGFLLIVATNQPDVAAGRQSRAALDAFHALLRVRLPLDDIRVCMELDSPECRCYKPKPGMLLDAAQAHDIDLSASYMIGDRWRDVGAGKAAGCFSIFVDFGYEEQRPELPDAIVSDPLAAIEFVLSREQRLSKGI